MDRTVAKTKLSRTGLKMEDVEQELLSGGSGDIFFYFYLTFIFLSLMHFTKSFSSDQ